MDRSRRKESSSMTIGVRITCLSSFYHFPIRRNLLSANPCYEENDNITAGSRELFIPLDRLSNVRYSDGPATFNIWYDACELATPEASLDN